MTKRRDRFIEQTSDENPHSPLLCPPHEKAEREAANGVDQIDYLTELVAGDYEIAEIRESHLPLMRAAWKTGWDDAEATTTRIVVAEFEQVDPSSMATRYPVDRSNSAFARPTQLVNFSITAFMTAFSRAADFLSSANLWIEVGLRLKAEGIDAD